VVSGILPDVEGGIPAARKKRGHDGKLTNGFCSAVWLCERLIPPGWEARLHVSQDG
jgi:hypothetical protein